MVLLTSEVGEFERMFWELGAHFVVSSPRRLDRIVQWIERNVLLHESPELTPREWVWARLPWGER
jgi:hypothetical protein